MSEADQARIAKSLNSIDHSMRELVKVWAAFNENFVALVKKLEEWEAMSVLDTTTEIVTTSWDNVPDEDKENAETFRRLKTRTSGGHEDWVEKEEENENG